MKHVIMMMEIAVDYPWRKTFAFNAFVKVNQTALTDERNWINHYFPLVFTCKNDKDCYGNGYCRARKCECLDDYEYEQDCSHYGCKYSKPLSFHIHPNSEFLYKKLNFVDLKYNLKNDPMWQIFYLGSLYNNWKLGPKQQRCSWDKINATFYSLGDFFIHKLNLEDKINSQNNY